MNELRKKSFWRWLKIGLGGLAVVVFLLFAGIGVIAKADLPMVPRQVKSFVKEKTGAEVDFSHYRFSILEGFPFLSLVLEDVSLSGPNVGNGHEELLRVGKLSLQFHFWKVFRRQFRVRAITLEEGGVSLFKNSDGSYSNTDFLKRDTTRARPPQTGSPPEISIDHVSFHNFSFRLVDSLRLKDYHFDLQKTRIGLADLNRNGQISLAGNWFFHGLTFKFKNGAFLHDKEAAVDWQLHWDAEAKKLNIEDSSTLEVNDETFKLSGFLGMGQPAHLKLVIEHPGIMLESVRQILAPNIRNSLSKYAIDKPVAAKVVVDGDLIPGRPAPTDVYFTVKDSEVRAGDTRITEASFSGHFYNCDPTGPVNPHSGCLDIGPLSGRLLDAIPVRATLQLEDLAAPTIRAEGSVTTPLARMQPALPPGKAELLSGQFTLNFKLVETPDGAATLNGGLQLSDAALNYLPTSLPVQNLNVDIAFEGQDLIVREFRADIDETPVNFEGKVSELLPFILKNRDRQLQASLKLRAGILDIDKFLPPKDAATSPRPRAKPKKGGGLNDIAATVQDFIDRFNAEVDIYAEGLKIRGYEASDVTVKSRLLSNCPLPGTAGGCFLLDTLSARIYDVVPITASAQLSDLDTPYLRLDLQLAGPLASFNRILSPEQLRLFGGDIDLALHYEGLLDDYFNFASRETHAAFDGHVILSDVSADYQDGKYRLRNTGADLEIDENHLLLSGIVLEVNDNRVELEGQVDDFIPFLFTEDGNLKARLAVRSPSLNFNSFPLDKNKEKKAKTKEKKTPSSLIGRKLAAVTEHLEADLRVDAGKVIFHEFDAEDVLIKGNYSLYCSPGQPPEGCVEVDTFAALVFGNAPLRASFTVDDLSDPTFTIDAWVNMPAKDLNNMLPPGQMQFYDGIVDLKLKYHGQPHNHFDVENAVVKAALSGTVDFSDVAFDYVSKGYEFRELEGAVMFDNTNVIIPSLALQLNGNKLKANGQLNRLIPFLFSPGQGVKVDLNVEGETFSLDSFSAPAKHKDKKVAVEGAPEPNALSKTLNTILDSTEVDFKLSVDELIYRDFVAQNLEASVELDKDHLELRDTYMQLGDGEFYLGGQISGLADNQPFLDLRANFREIDVSAVFESFDNFGIKDISYKNIKGILNADLSFMAQADDNYDLDPKSMKGLFVLNLADGVLVDFPMMLSLKNFLTKHREMENVRFGNLENIFRLEDQMLYIDQFELASSVVSFELAGAYDLGKRGRTDLLIVIPVANFFEGNYSQKALNSYFERGHGPSVLLRMTRKEADGKLQVSPTLSRRKFRNRKEE